LENGKPIRVILVDYKGYAHASIDSPEDVTRVERLIETQGELVPL
jgi:CMP-2-keto-3-deoxyoctulosonic acid synthetase